MMNLSREVQTNWIIQGIIDAFSEAVDQHAKVDPAEAIRQVKVNYQMATKVDGGLHINQHILRTSALMKL